MQKVEFMKPFATLVCEQLNAHKPEGFEDNYFEVIEITQNNGSKISGIATAANENVAPRIHMDKLYDGYCDGNLSIEQAADCVRESFSKELNSGNMEMITSYFSERLSDFSKVKDYIVPILVSKEKNLELLETVPSATVENLAVVFRVIFSDDKEKNNRDFCSSLVTNEFFNTWKQQDKKLNLAKLYRIAMENGRKLLPPLVESMQSFSKAAIVAHLIELGYSDEELCEQVEKSLKEMEDTPANNMYVITNKKLMYGASVILYTNVLPLLYEKHGPLYVIPSSTQELIAMPKGGVSPEEVLEIVKGVNGSDQVSDQEYLADSVYSYTFPLGLKQVL